MRYERWKVFDFPLENSGLDIYAPRRREARYRVSGRDVAVAVE
jgi:hypothetical protein